MKIFMNIVLIFVGLALILAGEFGSQQAKQYENNDIKDTKRVAAMVISSEGHGPPYMTTVEYKIKGDKKTNIVPTEEYEWPGGIIRVIVHPSKNYDRAEYAEGNAFYYYIIMKHGFLLGIIGFAIIVCVIIWDIKTRKEVHTVISQYR